MAETTETTEATMLDFLDAHTIVAQGCSVNIESLRRLYGCSWPGSPRRIPATAGPGGVRDH